MGPWYNPKLVVDPPEAMQATHIRGNLTADTRCASCDGIIFTWVTTGTYGYTWFVYLQTDAIRVAGS